MSDPLDRLKSQSPSLVHRVQGFLASRLGAELPRGAVSTALMRLAHMGFEFLALMLLARLLDPDAFGIYAVAMACAAVLGVPAAAGFDRLLVREVAANLAAEQWGRMRGVLRRATQLAMSSSGLLSAALVLSVYFWVTEAATRQALLLAALYLPLVAFARLRQAAMQGLGKVPQGMFTETVVQPATMILIASIAFLLAGVPRTGASAMGVQILSALLSMTTGIWLLRRYWPAHARRAAVEYQTSRWLGGAAPMMWMLGMNMLLTYADTLMLGWLSEESVAGRYRVASQVAMLVSFPMSAINLAVAPALARAYALGDLAGLRQSAANAARWSLAAAIPIAIGLMVAGKAVLGLFGNGFAAAHETLVVLSMGYVINCFGGAAGYVLIMTKHERMAAITFTVAAITNLLANYALIPAYGMMGAAVSTATSVALVGLGLWYFARRFVTRGNEVE